MGETGEGMGYRQCFRGETVETSFLGAEKPATRKQRKGRVSAYEARQRGQVARASEGRE